MHSAQSVHHHLPGGPGGTPGAPDAYSDGPAEDGSWLGWRGCGPRHRELYGSHLLASLRVAWAQD
jgi:hypothetical protein